MVKRDELIKFIYQTIGKDLLAKALKVDEVANGVQELGKKIKSRFGNKVKVEFIDIPNTI